MQVAAFDPEKHFLIVTRQVSAAVCRAVPALRSVPLAQLRRLLIAVIVDGEELDRWNSELGAHVLLRSRLTGVTKMECNIELLWGKEKSGRQRQSPNNMPAVYTRRFGGAEC